MIEEHLGDQGEDSLGIDAPEARREGAPTADEGSLPLAPSLLVRCFGGFHLAIDGHAVDLSSLRPRLRTLLRILSLHAGKPVHREVLASTLWPESDPRRAARNLHVAVSSLRNVLKPDTPRGSPTLIMRDGDAYMLAVPPDAFVDVVQFDRSLMQAQTALAEGDIRRSLTAFRRAVQLHEDELLPAEGPAEWVVPERERCRFETVDTALRIAEALLRDGLPARAAWVCHRALYVDRYRDALWRLLIEAYCRADEQAAAARADREYQKVLRELGVSPTDGVSSQHPISSST